MPDKNYIPNCGKGCVRCWKNKLKHANKLKKKQFPKQNIWDVPVPFNKGHVTNGDNIDGDSTDEEDYISNIDTQIKTKDDCYLYRGDYSEFKIYKFTDMYDYYNAWLSENKKLFEPSKKQFIKEFKSYIPSHYINNDTCEVEILNP